MNTTTADKHRRVDAEDLHERARTHCLRRNGTGIAAPDIVPVFAGRLRKTQRFLAFVAAMLVALFLACVFSLSLAWIFARALAGGPIGLAARPDATNDMQSAAHRGRDVTAPSFLSS
jgi:hypothetical protein